MVKQTKNSYPASAIVSGTLDLDRLPVLTTGKLPIKFTASDDLIHGNDTERSQAFAAYAKIKETKIQFPMRGTLRIKFDLNHTTGTGVGKIYKNGVAIGAEQTNNTQTYQTKSEDIAVDLDVGDLLQVYGYVTLGGLVKVRNFRINGAPTTYNSDIHVNQDP